MNVQIPVFTIGVVGFVAWRFHARVRRMIGRQMLSLRRVGFTLVLFPLILLMLLAGSIAVPWHAAALLAGIAIGAALGVYGLTLTRFEATPTGLFYTPNAHLGIALSLLFIGRIGYRFIEFGFNGLPGPWSSHELARSPLTLAIFGTLAGYYIAYAIGLLRWSRQPRENPLPPPSPVADEIAPPPLQG